VRGVAVEGVVRCGEVLVWVGRRGVVEARVEHGRVGEDWRGGGRGSGVDGVLCGGGGGLREVPGDQEAPGKVRVLDHWGENVLG